jgi:subfamily B ATP-binding cassette protein MsbA
MDAIAVARARRQDEEERDPRREREAMIRFLAYLKPSAPFFVIASLCGITIYLVPNMIPTAIGYVIDHILGYGATGHAPAKSNPLYDAISGYLAHMTRPDSSRAHRADILLGTLMAVLPCWGVLVFFRSYFAGLGGQRVIFKLRNDLYEHIQSLSLSYFSSERSGSIVSRLTSDIALAQNFIGNACTNLWMDSLSIVILSGVLFTLDRKLALVAMSILPVWVVSVRCFGQGIRKGSLSVQEGLSELSGQVQEKVSGVTVVQAFAREKYEMLSFHKLHHALLYRQIGVVRLTALNLMASMLLTTLAPVTVILVATHEVLAGRLTVGTLLMFWAMLQTFYSPLQRLTDLAAVIANASAAIERIFKIFDIEPDIKDTENARALPPKVQGRIELKDVSFGYDENMILKKINLTIEPGEVVAFVGPSGAGKSTLVQLIPRFYDVVKGKITIDGLDVRDLKVKSLRNVTGMVLQDNILFTGTIKDNILYGRPGASDDEIVEAAIAGNAHDFIQALAEGYETEIGERGTKLSGGQKQRIAITRAFLRDPRILILDEATSALDSESERQIQTALNRLMVGRTTLIIAHRLSTIMHADKIVVMQDGKIVEVGPHQQLLARQGLYYHLYKAQFEHALAMALPEEPAADSEIEETSAELERRVPCAHCCVA